MVTRKEPAKKEPAKKEPVKKEPAKKAAPKKAPAKKGVAKKALAKKPAAKTTASKKVRAPAAQPAAPAAAPAARKRDPALGPVQKTRVLVPLEVYDAEKDAIKAPFKALALKWNFLGEGKGLYKRPDGGVHCFVQFKDDGVHYSVWGDDKQAVGGILSTWRALLGEAGWAQATASGEEASAQEKRAAESDALRLWRLGEPQRRPGEPDLFFQKRLAEWQAKRPG